MREDEYRTVPAAGLGGRKGEERGKKGGKGEEVA